jgi:cytochrome P450
MAVYKFRMIGKPVLLHLLQRFDMPKTQSSHAAVYSGEPFFDFTNLDLFTRGHPYESYDRLRKTAPVFWHPERPPGSGFWLLSRYEDIQYVSRHPEIFSSAKGFKATDESYERLGPDIDAAMRRIIIGIDPPEHTDLRRLLQPFFSLKAVKALEDETRVAVREILGRLESGLTVEAVKAISSELPIIVLCHVLGIADEDRPRVFDWTNRMVGVDDPDFNTTPEQAAAAFYEVFEFGRNAIELRRKNPKDDLLSVLANAKVEGRYLDRKQTDGFAVLLVGAGNETSRNSITQSLYALAKFPDQRKALLENPKLWPTAVEELLRFSSPVIHMRRTATREAELSGQRIAPGEKVVMLYGAANRDPGVFEKPDALDLGRDNARKQMAFGHGIHLCLGAMFARMELRIMLEELLARFPEFELVSEPAYLRSNFVHGIKSMQIALH